MKDNRENLLVLLGSGATVPHVPGLYSLTTHLLEAQVPLASEVFGDAPADIGLFRYMIERLGINPASPSCTFESLLNILESLQSLHSRTSLFDRPDLITKLKNPKEINLAYQKSCYCILEKVLDSSVAVASAPSKPAIVSGLEALAAHFNLKVFSLNYDDLPLQSGIRFFDGYVDRGHLYDNFCPSTLFDSTLPGYHLNWHIPLHGSVRFGPDIRYRGVIPKYFSLEEAKSNWKVVYPADIDFFNADDYFADGIVNIPLPMITGYRKSDRALHEPYVSYLHALYAALRNCKKWLIVGYGGNDLHINTQLASVLRERAFNQPELYYASRIMVVDYKKFDNKVADYYNSVFWKDSNEWWEYISRLILRWGRTYWEKQAEDPFVGDGFIRRRSFSRITNSILLSIDGTQWAFTEGLDMLMNLLSERLKWSHYVPVAQHQREPDA